MQTVDRTRRVAELVRRALSTLIQHALNDSRISSVTVNAVRVSKDLKTADVFVSRFTPAAIATTAELKKLESNNRAGTEPEPPETPEQEVIRLLNNAAGFLRHLLSQTIGLRVTPQLRFKYDHSIRRGIEMSALIEKLNNKNATE